MKLQFKLSHKIVLLIAVPLVFELLFVGALMYSLNQLEVEHKRAEKNHAASMFFNVEMQAMIEAMGAMVMFNVLHENRYQKQFQNSVDTLRMQNDNLKKLAGTEMAGEIQALKAVSEEAISNINDIEKIARSEDRVDMLRGFVKVQRLLHKANSLGSNFISRETVMTEELEAQQAKARELIKLTIALGVGISILLSIILVALFNRGAAQQLKAIDQNMLKLAVQKPLNQPLSGADELARIDQTLFRLSKELEDLKNEQQQVYAMITHDLRSPLSSMKLVFDLLQAGTFGELNEKGKQRIKNSDHILSRLVTLTNDLLDVEKYESGNFDLTKELTSVGALFKDAIEVATLKADNKKLKLEADTTDLQVNCDKERIGRVLNNLLDNAIKFSSTESTINLSVTETGALIKITIKDQGKGIAKEQIPFIFERFKQANRDDETVQKGSGLGLAICKAIVEAHGGTIGVDSVTNEGSTFWFTLPKT